MIRRIYTKNIVAIQSPSNIQPLKMKEKRSLLLLLWIACVNCQFSETDEDNVYINCERHNTCFSCLAEHPECTWCVDSNFHSSSNQYPACSSRDRLIDFGCREGSIQTARNSAIDVVDDKQFTDVVDSEKINAIQIKPQSMSVVLSPFYTQSFEFEYRPAKNFPLDLYVLLDLTHSMEDDKKTIVNLNEKLLEVINNLTKNFRLAFGGFCDKPLMPFVSTEEKRKINPCSAEHKVCERTFDFHHKLNFTKNLKTFAKSINESSVTANIDNADGGFDALMQILVCEDQIGWSSLSRKIVLIATDSLPHFAGDGKLGGAVTLNDKQCHLNSEGLYTKAETMDYPSLEQIYRVLTEKKVSVIFAVAEYIQHYIEINRLLSGTSFVGKLDEDSSNILALVKEGYEKIASTVNFEVSEDDDIEFEFFSNCGREDRPFFKTNRCTGVENGKIYKFRVDMKIKENRRNIFNNSKRNIIVRESSLGQELLTVEIDMTTSCYCEQIDRQSLMKCPANAVFECGKCNCLPGWSGKNCDCKKDEEGTFNKSGCIAPGNKMSCSGNGECVCDSCECDNGWTGDYCNCRECPKNPKTGIECSSHKKGFCSCGTCVCREGWSGESCDCSDTTCKSPWSDNLCSGNGVCKCGICKCTERNNMNFTGKYCETCTTCANPACSLYENCVRQELKLNNNVTNPCTSNDGTMYIPVKMTDVYYGQESDKVECFIRFEDPKSDDYGCSYTYTYEVQKDWNTVLNIYDKSCQSLLKGAGVTLLLIAVIIAVALVAIIVFAWKCCERVRYRREYVRFKREQNNAMLMGDTSNPLYRPPITEFRVPEGYHREKDE